MEIVESQQLVSDEEPEQAAGEAGEQGCERSRLDARQQRSGDEAAPRPRAVSPARREG